MRRTKGLVFVLVLAMLCFGLVAVANAATFSDVAADNDAYNDITKLSALNIINGYPDGTFKPDGNITRAEFAKIAVVMAGLKDSAEYLQNSSSQYSDVTAGQWYTGWVNVASSQGYVKGYPDGTFKPNSNVTAAEAVTVLIRLLGYDDRLPGTWPTDYLAKASKLGITDDISFVASAPATRGLVAQFASETLEEDLVDYDTDIEDYRENGDTLLSDSFDEGAVIEDVLVTAIELSGDDYALSGYWFDDDDDIDEDDRDINKLELSDSVVVAGVPSAFALEGWMVNYIYSDDDDEIVYIEVVDDATKVFGRVDSLEFDGDEVKSIEIDDTDYDFNEKFFTSLSKMVDREYDAEDISATEKATLEASFVDYKVTAYMDADNEVVFVYRTSPDAAYVVDEVDVEDGEIEPKRGKTVEDLSDDDDFIIIKNGAPISLEDVEPGDVFYDVISNDKAARGFDRYIVVVSNSITGEFDRYDQDEFGRDDASDPTDEAKDDDTGRIDGTTYDFASLNNNDKQGLYIEDESGDEIDLEFANESDALEKLLGSEVTAYFDGNGEITYITGKSTDSTELVGAILDIGVYEGRGDDLRWIELFTVSGEEITYDIEDDYWDDNANDIEDICGDFDNEDPEVGVLVEYSLNSDGEIDDIELAEDDDDIDVASYDDEIGDPEEDYDRLYVAGGWKYVEDDTVVIDLGLEADGDTDPELSDWNEIEDSSDLDADVYYDGSDVVYIVVRNIGGISDSGIEGVFVGTYRNSDGDWMAEFYVDGELVEYEVDNNERSDLERGYIYSFDASGGEFDSFNDLDDRVYSYVLEDVGSSSIDVYLEDEDEEDANTANFKFDSETMVVEKDGSDFEIIDIDDLDDGDIVRVLEGDGDDVGTADIVVLLSDEDDIADVDDAFVDADPGDPGDPGEPGDEEDEVIASVTDTTSGLGVNLTVDVEGYEDAATWTAADDVLGDLVANPVAIGDSVVVLFVEAGDTITVTLFDADGNEIDTVDVEVVEE